MEIGYYYLVREESKVGWQSPIVKPTDNLSHIMSVLLRIRLDAVPII